VVQGKLEGNVQASDRVELRKSAVVTAISAPADFHRGAPTSREEFDIQGRRTSGRVSNFLIWFLG